MRLPDLKWAGERQTGMLHNMRGVSTGTFQVRRSISISWQPARSLTRVTTVAFSLLSHCSPFRWRTYCQGGTRCTPDLEVLKRVPLPASNCEGEFQKLRPISRQESSIQPICFSIIRSLNIRLECLLRARDGRPVGGNPYQRKQISSV